MFEKAVVLPQSPVLAAKRRPSYFKESICLAGACFILIPIFCLIQLHTTHIIPWLHAEHAANSTLGFGKIYAVSKKGSPRRQSLLAAASLTNLDITIPVQPSWTDSDIANIRAHENSAVDRGSALAWLGHLNALQRFLATNDEAALILEDDVDWDTKLRTQQIPQTAYAIQQLIESQHGYYGDPKLWDIIWLGHCGDYFNATRGSAISSIKSWRDPSMPQFDDLHPWTQDFMQEIGAGEDQLRLVHESVQPLCTFAYAITRDAALRVVNELAAREPERSPGRPCKAYDVRLLESCRDEGLKCITVNPELFHHSDLGSEIASASAVSESTDKQDSSYSTPGELMESATTNIRCSARSRKWQEIRNSITDPSVDVDRYISSLAERSTSCEIDSF